MSKTKLRREEFVTSIKEGGSRIWNGKVISTLDELPGDAELALASGDAEEIELTIVQIKDEIKRLTSELALLEPTKAKEAKVELKSKIEDKN